MSESLDDEYVTCGSSCVGTLNIQSFLVKWNIVLTYLGDLEPVQAYFDAFLDILVRDLAATVTCRSQDLGIDGEALFAGFDLAYEFL